MNVHLCGEANGAHKLTEAKVIAMRKRYDTQQPRCTIEQLAEENRVSYYCAYSAIHGLTWAHLTTVAA